MVLDFANGLSLMTSQPLAPRRGRVEEAAGVCDKIRNYVLLSTDLSALGSCRDPLVGWPIRRVALGQEIYYLVPSQRSAEAKVGA